MPSIMVTIFFGSEEWDGPLSLFDMMDVPDPEVLACMDNYHVRLIAPAQMSDEEIMKFQSSLREVMLFIKYSKDKENLSRLPFLYIMKAKKDGGNPSFRGVVSYL